MRHFKTVLLVTAALTVATGLPVMAQQAPAESSRQVIAYDTAFFKDFQVQSALDMVSRIPGFTLQNGDSVRGFAGAAGNVLIDGERPTTKTDAVSDQLNRISASDVERIDLIIGGADGIDMQGQSKIVNIIRKKSDKPTITFIANSRFLTNGWVRPVVRGTYSRNAGDKSIELSATIFNNFDEGNNNGEKLIFRTGGTTPERTEILAEAGGEGIELMGNGTHPLWGGKLSLNGKYVPNTYRAQYRYITNTTAVENLDYKEDAGEFGGKYVRPLGKKLTLKLNALTRWSDEDIEDFYKNPTEETVFDEASLSKENIVSGQLIWKHSDSLTIETGLEKAYNSLDSDNKLTINGVNEPLPASKVFVEEDRTEASVLATWQARKTVSVEAGLKYEWSTISQQSEHSDSQSFTYPKPKFQVTWSPKGPWQFTARFEREVGQLDFDDFVSSIDLMDSTVKAGNLSLEPSKTWVSELTANYRFWEKGAVVLKYVHSDISDVIDRLPIYATDGSVFDATGNIGDGTADQFVIDTTLPTDKLKIPGGVLKTKISLADSEVTDPVTKARRRMSGESRLQWEINYTQDLTRRKTQWGFRVNSGYDEKVYRVKEVSYYRAGIWANVFAEYKPTPKTSWRIELENITSRVYDADRDRYSGPRTTSPITSRELRRDRSEPWMFVRYRKEL
ncbi:TonB-dependent siderophore receptor [Asticcacaulis sp. YBE204]|uniref:TonB-dependent receptor plug domain-containing protein n=1 Tax=Asticcacaulis sp. YBE204 TaxID=1282363 RepID=UPI0003C3F5AD|nr:TonB-dependent receptor [Asticcacaulis sp. YBE204]ESQ77988.1 hypothetical protein AEYBE204_15950 [Asticcacaulis sp. YBE204]